MNITKMLKSALAAVVFAVCAAPAQAYYYVGTWNVHNGPSWAPNGSQPILTAQAAAAMLFGGSASEYSISTAGTDANNVNFQAWVSVWGGPASVVGQSYFQDTGIIGVYDTPGDTSAYIQDHCYQGNCINYAFKVPEPGSLALLGLSLIGVAYVRRRKQQVA